MISSPVQGAIEGKLAPLSILRMLWKRKVVVAATAFGLSAASGIVVYRLPARYKAEALVLVDEQKIPEKFVSATVNSDVGDRLATISQQIMSTTRLLKIISDFDLYKEERKTKTQEEVLEQMRTVDITLRIEKGWANGRPGAFHVGYQGTNPTLVAAVANQLASLYIEQNLETRQVQAEGTSEFLDNQLDQFKKDLDEQESKVAKFKQEHNGSLPEQQNPLLSTLANLQVQLQGVQDAINRDQQNKLMLETSLSTAQSAESALERSMQLRAEAGLPSDGTASAARPGEVPSKVLEEELQQLELRYTPDYPDVVALRERLAQQKQKEKLEADRLKASAAADAGTDKRKNDGQQTSLLGLSPGVMEEKGRISMLRAQIAGAERELRQQEQQREQILASINATRARVDQLPLVEQQMAALTRDYEISKANYSSLLEKKLAAGMATDMERRQKSERFEIIDAARVPEKPFKPNRSLLLTIAVIGSAVLGLVLAFGLEWRHDVLLGEWELPPGLNVLGRVPMIQPEGPALPFIRRFRTALAVSSAAFSLAVAALVYYMLEIRP